MKYIVSPDSFKGSLSAMDAAAAIARGIRRADPASDVVELPIADGGEGTLDVLLTATGGERRTVQVIGPLDGRMVDASFGVLPGTPLTAVIEMAQAAGLGLLGISERDPTRTTTFGVGQLIGFALDLGVDQIIVGLGGSCTNDGGAGAMSALGVRFLDRNGKLLPLYTCGRDLSELAHVDISDRRPIGTTRMIIASDVTNPLTGPAGASAVFGPQKGATRKQVEELDNALTTYADVLRHQIGVDLSQAPGGGAAGGLGAALMGFLGAEMRSGIDLVLDLAAFDSFATDADYVFTGEGRIDSQTLSGKAICGLLKRCQKHGVPLIAFGGSVDPLSEEQLINGGLLAAISISEPNMSVQHAISKASALLEAAAERTVHKLIQDDGPDAHSTLGQTAQ